jgi:hypothetical protein
VNLAKPKVISLPQGDSGSYLIDRAELLRLAQRRILGESAYIYFALNLDYPNGAEGSHLKSFCERWAISESKAVKAIATLEQKNVLKQKHQQLCFEFKYEDE